ncbi:MAG: iron-sulfur cluster assembly scaffold protein [Sphingorhabdus sp.]
MPVDTQPKSALYSKDLLRLAAGLPHGDRLAEPTGTATLRSPVCGSEIAADILMNNDGRVAALAFRARACAMGQASAALLRDIAIGHSLTEIESARAALAAALSGAGDFADIWPELAIFEPAQTHPGRHAAILLPYDALIAAVI